jgi:hypothetical protein
VRKVRLLRFAYSIHVWEVQNRQLISFCYLGNS